MNNTWTKNIVLIVSGVIYWDLTICQVHGNMDYFAFFLQRSYNVGSIIAHLTDKSSKTWSL